MNDDRASEIIRLLDSIDTTLREIQARPCECRGTTNVHNAMLDQDELAVAIRNALRRELRR